MTLRSNSIFLAALIAAAAMTASPALADDAASGSIAGATKWDGPKPTRAPVQTKADPKCAALHGEQLMTEDEIVGDGGEIQNVFVYVKNPPKGAIPPAPSEPAVLDQRGCSYHPHVQGMRVEQKLNVVSSDATLHNVRSIAKLNKPINMAQPAPGTRETSFKKPEMPIKFKCDVHTWMTGYIFVMDHPFYAVTGADGAYEIKGLPAGEYTVIAWHEKYGKQESKITVAAGAKAEGAFTFKPPQKK